MKFTLPFLLLCVIALVRCGKQDTDNIETFELNKPFAARTGVLYQQADGPLEIRFKKVVEDSRCPVEVICVWSGLLAADLSLQAGGVYGQDTLSTYQNPPLLRTFAYFQDYKIELQDALPLPTDKGIPQDMYFLKLMVTPK